MTVDLSGYTYILVSTLNIGRLTASCTELLLFPDEMCRFRIMVFHFQWTITIMTVIEMSIGVIMLFACGGSCDKLELYFK